MKKCKLEISDRLIENGFLEQFLEKTHSEHSQVQIRREKGASERTERGLSEKSLKSLKSINKGDHASAQALQTAADLIGIRGKREEIHMEGGREFFVCQFAQF